jgi:hypothetical protein
LPPEEAFALAQQFELHYTPNSLPDTFLSYYEIVV